MMSNWSIKHHNIKDDVDVSIDNGTIKIKIK